MQELGNAITVLGILVTFVAYFGRHSGVSLADLEPGITKRWRGMRRWVRRRLGRPTKVIAATVTAREFGVTATARGMVWRPIQPDDDIAVRVDKLEHNLDALHARTDRQRWEDQEHVREVTDRLSEQMTNLDQVIAARHQESRQETTAAMRWEVRGLLITLVGAGLSIFG